MHMVVRRLHYSVSAAIAFGLLGCFPSEYTVEVRVRYPDDSAVTNIEITALPFDRDVIRDSLSEASELPRPQFPDLENQLADYRRPDVSGLEESFAPWQAIHDSVQHLADSLSSGSPDSSTRYTRAYGRLRDQYQRLAHSTVQRDAALREQVGDDRDLAMRVAAAADSLRAWEGTALASFPRLADSTMARVGRTLHRATTNADGVAEFTLEPGRWWFVARWTDPENPFREYYWSVGVRVGWVGSRSVPLYDGNGIGVWRY
jgi:hypothetical protein